ncbi:MAG: hypothetical protein JSW00_04690 [Thermoplasmata archaeon]|nr:MAG: hypothetical protein JSW00_04690 [Thermoplasmata archaeon]
MSKVYEFKAAFKRRKGLWRRIQIKDDQTLKDFDSIMRKAFNHDKDDHLSEFFPGRAWRSKGFGEIDPTGKGKGSKLRIKTLGLSEGDKLEYVYDFGDDIQHIITFEKMVEPKKGTSYPRIIAKNKPKYNYCEACNKQGKKTKATWVCIECTNEREKALFLCDDCLIKEHEEHYADELTY